MSVRRLRGEVVSVDISGKEIEGENKCLKGSEKLMECDCEKAEGKVESVNTSEKEIKGAKECLKKSGKVKEGECKKIEGEVVSVNTNGKKIEGGKATMKECNKVKEGECEKDEGGKGSVSKVVGGKDQRVKEIKVSKVIVKEPGKLSLLYMRKQYGVSKFYHQHSQRTPLMVTLDR